ncbi:MAG: (Fe-S)-binding protein [Chthoniobacterales bacterium]
MSGAHPLKDLDYSVVQQCMHCGMCLPTCPTYDATKLERNSPRGRIALMRSIVDGRMEPTKTFADEMYFCLGCLACETACPAGVDYTHLFEMARAEAEQSGVLESPKRNLIRSVVLKGIFTRPRLLHLIGRGLWLYQATGVQALVRALHLTAIFPERYRNLEKQTPVVHSKFSADLIAAVEKPNGEIRHRVAVLTGCVQDLTFSDINRDTADVLLINGCEVHTPRGQYCCGSLHGHNGEIDTAKLLARRNLDMIDPFKFDAVITNAAGCGSHLKHYDRLLEDDPTYKERAAEWSRKLKDVHEYLVEINFRKPTSTLAPQTITYHEACHLCHGQKITKQPRSVLQSIPGLKLTELPESMWCCGSAGIYNITQPEMAGDLQKRKMGNIASTGAPVVATANPGCHLQLENGAKKCSVDVRVRHPISMLAEAYRAEGK